MGWCDGASCQAVQQQAVNRHLVLVLVQVDASFFSEGLQALGVQGLEGFGREAQTHPAVALGPPNPLPLQIHFLQLFGAAVRVGNGVGVVGFLASQLTDTRHGFLQAEAD